MIQLLAFEGRWVYVGKTEETDKYYIIRNGVNVRYWGTTRGLGQLSNGPTDSTKLDPIPTIRVPIDKLTAGGMHEVNQEKWKDVLKKCHEEV